MTTRSAGLLLIVMALGCSNAESDPEPTVAVEVTGVAIDPHTNSPVVILEENNGGRRLPIWIGFAEARSIAIELEHLASPRPNSHDLTARLLKGLEGTLERIVVTDLRDGTYYAILEVQVNGRRIKIDARPSDAIAVALRAPAPLFVRTRLFDAAENSGPKPDVDEREALLLPHPEQRIAPASIDAEMRSSDGIVA